MPFVEEGSLTHNISTLRKVLATGDNPQGYIETLSKRGYRFQPVVRTVPAAEPAVADIPVPPAAAAVARRRGARADRVDCGLRLPYCRLTRIVRS